MIIDRYKLQGHAPAVFYVNPEVDYCGKALDPLQDYYVDQLDFNEDVITVYDDRADTYYELLLTQGALCELVGFDNDHKPIYVGDTVESLVGPKKLEFEVGEGGVLMNSEYPNNINVPYEGFENYHKTSRYNRFIMHSVSQEVVDEFKKEWLINKNYKCKPGQGYRAFGVYYKACAGHDCRDCAFSKEHCDINPYIPNCTHYGVHFEVEKG